MSRLFAELTVNEMKQVLERDEVGTCVICNGSGFDDDVFNEIGTETDCIVCNGKGVKS